MSFRKILLLVLFLLMTGLLYYLFRPMNNIPDPASFTCIDMTEGHFIPFDSLPKAKNIYGMGLTYSDHLRETAAEFDPSIPPPIFKKKLSSLTRTGSSVSIPSSAELRNYVGELETEVSERLITDFPDITAMLDYEVELGFVLLEDISASDLTRIDHVPEVGYFIANDLSARSLALLGEGSPLRYEYWGLSKSFPGFTPVSDNVWIPLASSSNSIPCITIQTLVNGVVRQSQTTDNMIYTPLEMLQFIQNKYPDETLKKGDLILTGTPGGVAVATPRALVRMSNLMGMDRYKKLSIKQRGDQSKFLQKGDVVVIRGGNHWRVENTIVQ